ncbi:MAG: flippase-like domain-containing protein [candidate division Zixibacteria bacterium]|nr:flippase-like domain-containing protein [candidate division Zixibacteria bacterium]
MTSPRPARTAEPPKGHETGTGAPAWKRWLTIITVAVVGYFLVRSIVSQWDTVSHYQWSLRWDWLLLSAALVWIDFVVLILLWRFILKRIGQHTMPFWTAYRVWFLSNFGKYLPGKVWTVMGMVVLLKAEGYSAAPVLVSAILNQALSILSGLALSVIVLGAGTFGNIPVPVLAGIAVLLLAILYPPLLQWGINLGLRIVRRDPITISLPFATIAGLFVVYLATWIAYGGAFWLLLLGIGIHPSGSFLQIVAIFAASYLIGFLALFVPGGLAVREGALSFLITNWIPAGLAAPVALLSRIWLTVTELLGAVPLLWMRGSRDTT